MRFRNFLYGLVELFIGGAVWTGGTYILELETWPLSTLAFWILAGVLLVALGIFRVVDACFIPHD